MAIRDSLRSLLGALQGISTFAPEVQPGPVLSDDAVRAIRKALGGNLEPIPPVKLRWYPPDIERAQRSANSGDLLMVGQLVESMRLDGVFRGLSDARTSVVSMPQRIFGDREIVEMLQSKTGSDRNVLEEMIPATEAKLMVGDGLTAGVAIGEMVPVVGRNFPVLVRRFVQNLFYMQTKNQWYYRSFAGLMPISPGSPSPDGNMWILHMPGGRLAPWNSGLWNTCGRSYINKTQAMFARQSYVMKHAHPARVATSALGATEDDREGVIRKLIAWALNGAFVLPLGWDLKLIEAKGEGIKVYDDEITTYNEEMASALCGSSVMLKGTVGFGNIDPFQMVAMDLMRTTAGGWDHTVNTQILPALIGTLFGEDALSNATTVKTEVKKPADRKVEADTMTSLGNALKILVESVAAAQRATGTKTPVTVDVAELLAEFGIPTQATTVEALEQAAPPAAPGGRAPGGAGGNGGGGDEASPPDAPKEPPGKADPPAAASLKRMGAAAAYDEDKHPRADDGKFGKGGGSGKSEAASTSTDYHSASKSAADYFTADPERHERIRDFTEYGHLDMNAYLRDPKGFAKENGGAAALAQADAARQLRDDMIAAPKFEGQVYYRGIRSEGSEAVVQGLIEQAKSGTMRAEAFWFASTDPGLASKVGAGVQIEIHAKSAVAIENVSAIKGLKARGEAIIPHKTGFEVRSIETSKGVTKIVLHETESQSHEDRRYDATALGMLSRLVNACMSATR